jgi:hypothetical protein
VSDTAAFGFDGWAMPFDPSADPAEVAARYAMSRLIARARAQLSSGAKVPAFLDRLYPGDAIPAAGSAKYKACSRLILGKKPVAVADLLAWSFAFDVPLEEVLGGGLADKSIYPPQFRGSLDVPDSGPPRFRSRRIDWTAATSAFLAVLEEDVSQTGPGFVNPAVARAQLVRALVAVGVDRAVLRPSGLDRFDLLLGRSSRVLVRTCCDDDDDAWEDLVASIVSAPAEVLVTVLGASARARAQSVVPGLFESDPGSAYDVPIQAFEGRTDDFISPTAGTSWTIETAMAGEQLTAHVLFRKSVHFPRS